MSRCKYLQGSEWVVCAIDKTQSAWSYSEGDCTDIKVDVKNMSNVIINKQFKNKKFKFWAAPIVDRAFGSLNFQDVMDFLNETSLADFYNEKKPKNNTVLYEKALKLYKKRKKAKLASEVLPLINKGTQPIGPTGPSDNFKTKNHKWEHHTVEYKRLRNLLFGAPPDQPEVVDTPSVTTVVKRELLS